MIRRDFIGVTLPRIAAPWFGDVVWRIPAADDERVAYLTYDDGPTESGTNQLIDILGGYEAQATFFLLGRQVEKYDGMRNAVEEAGHLVGVHGYAHLDAWMARRADVASDLGKAIRAIRPAGRFWYRPPYGHFTPQLIRTVRAAGGRVAMWDILGGEFYRPATAAEVTARVCRYIRPGSIITIHDNEHSLPLTLEITQSILDRLVPEGWSFRQLPNP